VTIFSLIFDVLVIPILRNRIYFDIAFRICCTHYISNFRLWRRYQAYDLLRCDVIPVSKEPTAPIFSTCTSPRQWGHQLPSKNLVVHIYQNTQRLITEDLNLSTIKTTSTRALSLKYYPSVFWLFYKIFPTKLLQTFFFFIRGYMSPSKR
jgi:hypothetical protein